MEEEKFLRLRNNIDGKISQFNFKIINPENLPNDLENFLILCKNRDFYFQIEYNSEKYFIEVLNKSNNWVLLTDYIKRNYEISTLLIDMQLHKLYLKDFSMETNLKFIDKFLLLVTENNIQQPQPL